MHIEILVEDSSGENLLQTRVTLHPTRYSV